MKRVLIAIIAIGAAIGIVIVALQAMAAARYKRVYDVRVDPIPIPFPLTDEERAALHAAAGTADNVKRPSEDELAAERAIARGSRYLNTRAVCRDCHGSDLGGKVMVSNPVLGRLVAPNITRAGVTRSYKPEDWVRIIRHGLRPDGTPSMMPALDFSEFSDQEISDIAAYVQSVPPVQRTLPAIRIGPALAVMILKGDFAVSAEIIDHRAPRHRYPPEAEAVNGALGEHLAATCRGCHGVNLSGGRILGADPAWPPARNLTFDASGLAGWSLAQFTRALRLGVRPDGNKIDPVMPTQYTSQFSDAEIASLYAYLQTVPRRPYGGH